MDNPTARSASPNGQNGAQTPRAGTPQATQAAQETVAAAMAAGQSAASPNAPGAQRLVDSEALYDEMARQYPYTPPRQSNTRLILILVGIIALLVILVIILIVFGQPFRLLPTTVVRDVLVILLAIESIVVLSLMAWLVFQVRSLLLYMNTEVKPVLENVNVTLTTMKDTTGFLRDTAVSPVIKTQSYATGAVETMRALFRRPGGPR